MRGCRRDLCAAAFFAPYAAPSTSEPKPQDAAEPRQVTVMFTDLVGSTALSARYEPHGTATVPRAITQAFTNGELWAISTEMFRSAAPMYKGKP